MTAPQPTHDQAHEASLQDRERGQLLLLDQLRKSNAKLAADASAKAEEIAELKRELASLSSARQSDRELVDDVDVRELRRKIEAQAKHITELERVRKREQAIAAGQINTARNETRQVEGTLKLRDATVARLEERAEAASRELVELRERAEGAEAELVAAENRIGAIRSRLSVAEGGWNEAVTALKSVSGIHDVQLAELRASLAAAEARAEGAERELQRVRVGVEKIARDIESNMDPDFGLHERLRSAIAPSASSTTPAEQPGRAGECIRHEVVECEKCGMSRVKEPTP